MPRLTATASSTRARGAWAPQPVQLACWFPPIRSSSPPSTQTFSSAAADAPSGNVAAAQQFLDDAGYQKNSSGKYLGKDGKPITFSINVVSGWTDWDQIVAIMVQNLNQLGLTVTANQTQFAEYYSGLQTGQVRRDDQLDQPGTKPVLPVLRPAG